MKTLYIECNMGVAGDMFLAALLDLLPEPEGWVENFNALGIPEVEVLLENREKCGILGKGIQVKYRNKMEEADARAENHHGGAHESRDLREIREILFSLPISEKVRQDTMAVYQLIAEAEAKVHGREVDQIHFHEIGMMDAVVDILGVSMLLEELDFDRILASPVRVGSGQVQCAHGILPVPAPATALLLHGIPSLSGQIEAELCTPTGAALLKYFVDEFGQRPEMITERVGYGMGRKDFPIANCLRAFCGEAKEQVDEILELVCSLDDVTGEELAFAQQILLEEGALDVYLRSVLMKKGRPGHELLCLCRVDQEEKMVQLILKHTPTLGLRCHVVRRHRLERTIVKKETNFGELREKVSSGYGVRKTKLEYDDLSKFAKALNHSH